MRLAASNIAWGRESDDDMYAFLAGLGYSGLEIAPTALLGRDPYSRPKDAADFSRRLFEAYGLEVCSMQSLWYGRGERLFAGGAGERAALADYTRRAVDFAAACRCRSLVLGSPKNRRIENPAQRPLAVEFLREISEYANTRGCAVALEANPAAYDTNFINTTREAADICREAACRGLGINLDTGAMILNSESPPELSEDIGLVRHVHISEPFLAALEPRRLHRELSELLRGAGYGGFVSIEMASRGDLREIKRAAEYVLEVFSWM
jgi:sugar phosphate isomerase/epimerase